MSVPATRERLAPSPAPHKTAEDVLRITKTLLPSEQFWAQGEWQTNDGRMCIGGALAKAARIDGRYTDEAYVEALNCLQEAVGPTRYDVWNDAPERTFEDVERALDTALYYATSPNQER